ncbi:MAG: gamma-glutamyl-gamma-aminobutyrate hydrolase family protein [Bacteriovoracaceae bacterium]|nr:gamma-glutamyl-gamma-aminobutyrate hydrolase family protein [Bacteriovoracaceae bacterium]
MKTIAFIDNFIETPVIHSVNDFILRTKLPCSYHMPATYGMESLKKCKQADGYVLLGSASHVTEKLDWHQQLLDFLLPKIEKGTPVLGICFGHQLLAYHFGSEVNYIHQNQTKHTEAREISFLNSTLGIQKNTNLLLGFSHSQEVKTVPTGFDVVAKSKICAIEALKHKKLPIWTFQSHPEASEFFLKDSAELQDEKTIQQVIRNGQAVLDGFVREL